MAEGWAADIMERFEAELSRLMAGGNRKAAAFSLDVAESMSLEEKRDKVAAWRSLTISIVTLGRVTAKTQDLPSWQEVSVLLDAWCAKEGVPALVASGYE